MSTHATLTVSERRRGQRQLLKYHAFNGFSVACMMDNVLILYAIHLKLSDAALAVLASLMFLTMPFMMIGRLLIRRFGLAGSWGLCWASRYVFGLLMIIPGLLVIGEIERPVPMLFMLGAFGFFAARAAGLVSNAPLMGELTTLRDRGAFMSRSVFFAFSSYLVSMCAVLFFLGAVESLWVYLVLLGAGCLVGFYASYLLTRVPESDNPRQSARMPIRDSLALLLTTVRLRRLLLAWCFGLAAMLILQPFSMVLLKRGYEVSDFNALFYAAIMILGGIGSSVFNGSVSDHVGPRPLFIMHVSGLFAMALFWSFAPTAYMPVLVAAVFLLVGFFAVGVTICIQHYFLSCSGESDRVGLALFNQMLSGGFAGLVGSVGGGLLLKTLHAYEFEGLEIYRWFFRGTLPLLGIGIIAANRLERLHEWRIRNMLGLFLSVRDMRAMFALSRMAENSGYADDMRDVARLERIGSPISQDKVLGYLRSSRLGVRGMALRALNGTRLNSSAKAELLQELERGEFTTAWLAAEQLGDQGVQEAIPLLREALHSEDFILCGKSMVALVALRDRESYGEIIQRFVLTANPRVALHGAEAIALMGERDKVLDMFRKACNSSLPGPVRDGILNAAADLCGFNESAYLFLKQAEDDRRAAAEILTELLSRQMPADWVNRFGEALGQSADPARLRSLLREEAGRRSTEAQKLLAAFLRQVPEGSISCKTAGCLALWLASQD